MAKGGSLSRRWLDVVMKDLEDFSLILDSALNIAYDQTIWKKTELNWLYAQLNERIVGYYGIKVIFCPHLLAALKFLKVELK